MSGKTIEIKIENGFNIFLKLPDAKWLLTDQTKWQPM